MDGPSVSLGHVPGEKWAFDDGVTACFDDMLARSIPEYNAMRTACGDMAGRYIRPDTDVVDLGCSRGAALVPLIDRFGAHNRFVGLEVSPPMLEAVRERFKRLIAAGVVDIREWDLRKGYPPVRASLTLSVLTLQFTPIEYRQRIVREVFKHTLPGGAFILVEKVLGESAELDQAHVELYHGLKHQHGYGLDEIERKRLALEGVLVPVTARWNEDLLRGAGFSHVDGFWRYLNFAGWVAVKE